MLTAIKSATAEPPVWPATNQLEKAHERHLDKPLNPQIGSTTAKAPRPVAPKRHRRFFRAPADGALDVITVVDEFGTVVYKNPSAEAQLGYQPGELVGRNLFEFVHPGDISRVRAAFDECRRNGGAWAPIEHRIRHADGLWRTFESVGRFQSDGAGGRVGIIHSRDVRARKLLEAQVLQSQKMETVGLSTGAIAHDFNNMLVVIAGYTALLENDESNTVREFAREMRLATDRATELTRQLLSFARTNRADEPTCDANEAVTDFRPILDRMVGRDVRVSYSLEASACEVSLSRSALDQVLINLVVNARDAMPAGGELTVTTATEWRPRQNTAALSQQLVEYLVLRVTDTGVGMAEDVKARVFEPFFTMKAPGRGTGIGLRTVHGIVSQAGGRIDVISAPGSGTTFRVLLPVQAAH